MYNSVRDKPENLGPRWIEISQFFLIILSERNLKYVYIYTGVAYEIKYPGVQNKLPELSWRLRKAGRVRCGGAWETRESHDTIGRTVSKRVATQNLPAFQDLRQNKSSMKIANFCVHFLCFVDFKYTSYYLSHISNIWNFRIQTLRAY